MLRSALKMRQKNTYVLFVFFLIAGVLFGLRTVNSPLANAATDTCTWTGSGADANMSTAGNWSGCDNGNVPQDGDNLIFPSGPVNKIVTVNSDMGFASITFSGSGYTVSSAAFESLGVYSSLTISGNNNSFNGYVRLYPTTSTTVTHSGTGTSFGHYIVIQPLAANTDIVFDIDSDLSVPMISQTAIDGSSSIDTVTKTGFGTLDLTGTAIAGITASSGLRIEEGTWKCDSEYCLGADTNEIFLDSGSDPDGPSLALNGDDTVPNPITVNTGAGVKGEVSISANITLSGAITMHNNLDMFVSGAHTATVSSNLAMDSGTTMTLYGADGYTTNNYTFSGIISGDGGLIIDDAHVTLSGTNTYTGDTEITDTGSGGVLSVTNVSALGTTSGKTIVNAGTTLNFSSGSDQTYEEPLQIAGTGVGGVYLGAIVNDNSYRNLSGNVVLTGNATVVNNINELTVFSGQISGDFDLTFLGGVDNGSFVISPPGANSFGNTIAVGTQLLINGAGVMGIPGDLTMNAVNSRTSRIWMNNDNTIADDSVITLNNSDSQTAYLLNTGVSDTVGTIEGDGTIFMGDSDSHFNIGGGNTSGTFSGTVQGYTNAQFQITGGVWTFSGYNTDVGNGFSSYYITGGKFIANAADVSLGMSPFSISSGILGGTDIIGPVSVYGGTVAPGNSPGCLYPTGDIAFTDEFSILNVELNGTTQCTGYDVLNASGVVYLNGATLDIELINGYLPNLGDVFTIVQGSSVVGTFKGLSDGATFTIGSRTFRINYSSTSVTLTDVTPAVSSVSEILAQTGSSIYMLTFVALALGAPISLIGLKHRIRSLNFK